MYSALGDPVSSYLSGYKCAHCTPSISTHELSGLLDCDDEVYDHAWRGMASKHLKKSHPSYFEFFGSRASPATYANHWPERANAQLFEMQRFGVIVIVALRDQFWGVQEPGSADPTPVLNEEIFLDYGDGYFMPEDE